MRPRLAIIGLIIALYSGIILSIDSLVLPRAGIDGFAVMTTSSIRTLEAIVNGEPVPDSAGPPQGVRGNLDASRYFGAWLRPFGIHRQGFSGIWWSLASFSVLATVGSMMLFFFPRRIRYVSGLLREEPLGNHVLNALIGISAYVVAYVVLRLSWLTVAIMPLIPLLVSGVWLVTMLGVVSVSFTLGRLLSLRARVALPPLVEALLGLWLLFVTTMLPYLGWILGGTVAAMGFGALLQTRFGSRQRWSLEALEEPPPEPELSDPKIVQLRRAR